MQNNQRTTQLTDLARAMGFDLCGVAPAADFPELTHLQDWLARGYAGEMRYLHDPRRQAPALVLESVRSVIVCALNYNAPLPYSTEVPAEPAAPAGPRGWISRYAWGNDYHEAIGDKLDSLVASMRQIFPEPFAARAYVDTGPLLERIAAKYAGLGWLGKNTCLIHEGLGSWQFLGVILTTLDLTATLEANVPAADLCGNCRLCIDACPTAAIVEPYVLDARRCISYLTIELRGSIPVELRPAMGRQVFGCDICQDVCPWNRQAAHTTAREFNPRSIAENSLYSPSLEWLISITEAEFKIALRGSPVKRAKWRGLVRNACVALGNSGLRPQDPRYAQICGQLRQLAASGDALLAEHAQWALQRLGAATSLPPPATPAGCTADTTGIE